jgi:mRNA interferase HigB
LRIIARKKLKEFWETPSYKDCEQALKSWFAIAKHADWATPQAVKDQFGNASIIGDNRVVFNIAGNKYRLIVKFHYRYRVGYVRFVGTREQYDAVDEELI